VHPLPSPAFFYLPETKKPPAKTQRAAFSPAAYRLAFLKKCVLTA
jgi:hypothetical protein